MKKSDFLKTLKNALEITSVNILTEETVLRDLEEYSSIFLLAVIVFIDEYFDMQVSAEQLANVTNIKSLIDLIGNQKFD